MATQAETDQIVAECLQHIGQELKINFKEFVTETYTQGGYRSGTYTYKTAWKKVSLEYWFSGFSSRKEDVDVTYSTDEDAKKLETDLRESLSKLQQFVKKKKGMF